MERLDLLPIAILFRIFVCGQTHLDEYSCVDWRATVCARAKSVAVDYCGSECIEPVTGGLTR